MNRFLTLSAVVAVLMSRVVAADQPMLTDQQRTDAIIHLNWLHAGTYKLPASNSTIALPEGYVAVDDWADVDPVKMLDAIRENTEEANAERRQQGVGEMHVVGWLQRPT